ncbi:plasmid transfer protein TraB [Streptomyces noursei]|uniref:plasmid transfer protein TraB n=1 Tax=Streptomyces noursei TaxID=1971 RepID=UPI00167AD874|nr:plasmid transfer protein TraB [Streptomyces noursei]MCZ1013971.1 plasmid transfer protein TraB [Streptomyces noursei]GGX40491.1 sporulation protein SsgA [Streptomyces noursei]
MSDSPKADLWKAIKNPHSRPWLAVIGEIPATFVAHQAWGASTVAAIGMTVASGALTVATWWGAEGTKPARRIHATITMGLAVTYTTVATFTDPIGAAQLSTLAMGGAVAAASWNVRKAMRVNPEAPTENATAGETGLLVKSLGRAKASLRKTPEIEPNKVIAPYQLAPGEMTNAEVGRRIDSIASELGVSPNAIRIQADPENASQGQIILVPKDMLTDGTPWPGPSCFGGSIAEPVVIGVYEDGAPEQFWFPHCPVTKRNATHFLGSGMNGSGKSEGFKFAIVEALTRRDAIVWGIDPSKGRQTFGPLLPFMDWVALTEAEGNDVIDALSQVITARADALGAAGFKNWTPEAYDKLGMPYMIVWVEEAAKFFRNGTEMEGLVMEARSAGISVIISLQRPSATSMPTDVREQLGGVLCFGVKGSTTAAMALPDDVLDAGARPEAWENRKPGYNYLVAPGIDEERYPMKARTFIPLSDEEIVAALSTAPITDADPVTVNAAGEAYANRAIHTVDDVLTSTDTTPDTRPQETTVMTKADNEAAQRALLEKQADREVEAMVGIDPDDDGYVPDVDPDQEIKPTEGTWTFGQPEPRAQEKTPEEAVAELLAMLDEYRDQELETVGPKEFQPYGKGTRIGRCRAWVSTKLGELADEGVHLEDTPQAGVYKLLYPELAAA